MPAVASNLLLIALLAAVAVRDARTRTIPNAYVAAVLAAWVLVLLVQGAVECREGVAPAAAALNLAEALGWGLLRGAVLAGGVFLVALAVERVTGREALGGGDVKLLFALGAWCPLWTGLWGLLISCGAAVVIGLILRAAKGEDTLPFGVAMALGWAVAVWL